MDLDRSTPNVVKIALITMDALIWLAIELYGSFVEVFCSNSPLDLHYYWTREKTRTSSVGGRTV